MLNASSSESTGQVVTSSSSSSPMDSTSTIPLQPAGLGPTSFSTTTETSRILELELMHRWATKTWSCSYSIPEDREYLQDFVPHDALGKGYLMNAIFALAAADLAHGGQQEYVAIAYQYSRKATAEFQLALSNANTENIVGLCIFSVLCVTFNVAMPSTPSAFEIINSCFDMSAASVEYALMEVLWRPPCVNLIMSGFPAVSLDFIDRETSEALGWLVSVSSQVQVLVEVGGIAEYMAMAEDVRTYKLVIDHIQRSFAEEARGEIKAYWYAIVNLVPQDFFVAAKKFEPMALLIYLYLGVLMDKDSKDPYMWWIASTGKNLVREVSELLEPTLLSSLPDAQKAIAWSHEQVGLPPRELPVPTV